MEVTLTISEIVLVINDRGSTVYFKNDKLPNATMAFEKHHNATDFLEKLLSRTGGSYEVIDLADDNTYLVSVNRR